MKKYILSLMMGLCVSVSSFAQSHSDRISVGAGALYQRGLDATISWEHETRYHNAWEYFINGYIKWDECASCGHVCPESFGTTTEHGELALPTNPVWQEAGTTTETSGLAQVLAVTQTSLSVACMSVTNIILPYVMGGDCLFKPNVISLFPSEKTCFAQASW